MAAGHILGSAINCGFEGNPSERTSSYQNFRSTSPLGGNQASRDRHGEGTLNSAAIIGENLSNSRLSHQIEAVSYANRSTFRLE